MIQQIKELRVRIDGLHQLTKDLKPLDLGITGFNSHEIDEAAKSLILAKAWLGKLLGELGNENPYSSGKKEIKDIESTADVAKNLTVDVDGGWEEMSHIEKVDWLRSDIQKVIDEIRIMEFDIEGTSYLDNHKSIARLNSYNHLSEARFWLGFEFQRIKEDS